MCSHSSQILAIFPLVEHSQAMLIFSQKKRNRRGEEGSYETDTRIVFLQKAALSLLPGCKEASSLINYLLNWLNNCIMHPSCVVERPRVCANATTSCILLLCRTCLENLAMPWKSTVTFPLIEVHMVPWIMIFWEEQYYTIRSLFTVLVYFLSYVWTFILFNF
jgi:hypothetical protein